VKAALSRTNLQWAAALPAQSEKSLIWDIWNSEITMQDPGLPAKPYLIKRLADPAQGYDIYELICAENERDARHMVGKWLR
jgi:hypothetical protein